MIRKSILLIFALTGTVHAQNLNDPQLLWEQATLYRDEWGVPHVYADNPRAMAFAFGYAQAEDHLEAMLFAYRIANGRAAEVFGERYAASDEFAIKMYQADLAREAYTRADDTTRALCEGFALGVNSWLIEHRDRVPSWAEGVTPPDLLALMHSYLMSMAPLDLPGVSRPAADGASANAWAVGPAMTEDGKAILVINPHADYESPYQWYEAHLACPGFNMAGATLFGLPVILQGHNEVLGWALAPNQPDFADVYVERPPRFTKNNPKSVRKAPISDEVLYRLLVAAESKFYYVRTAGGLQKRVVQRLRTDRGPVISWKDGRALSYRVGGYGEFGALRQFFEMGKAGRLTEFQQALSMHQIPCFHIVYADREGNIFYRYNAKVGEKLNLDPPSAKMNPQAIGYAGSRHRSVWDGPLSSMDSAFQWGPIIPPEALPSLLNPKSGYIQACGGPPWLATVDTGTGPRDWPSWFARDHDSYRAKRIRQLFSTGPRSFLDNQSMLYDLVVPFAADAVPYLLDLAERNPGFVANAHPDLTVGLDMLRDWNYLADTDSMAMTFFHVWWSAFQAASPNTIRSVNELYERLRENSPAIQQHALRAASEAAKLMRNQFQSLNVPWGDVHTLRRGGREVPMPGATSGEPLFVSSDREFLDGKWPVRYGYGFAMAVRFGEKPEAVSLVPFGASEVPDSPHYDDQMDLLIERRFKVTRFERADVERHAVSARGKLIVLRPNRAEAYFFIRAATPIKAKMVATDQFSVPLATGFTAFTPYMEPQVEPHKVPLEIYMEFEIPDALCARENLDQLRVYGYHPQVQWYPLPEQELDQQRRTFMARAYDAHLYAVLGPETYRRPRIPVASRVDFVLKPEVSDSTPKTLDLTKDAVETTGEEPSQRTRVTKNFNQILTTHPAVEPTQVTEPSAILPPPAPSEASAPSEAPKRQETREPQERQEPLETPAQSPPLRAPSGIPADVSPTPETPLQRQAAIPPVSTEAAQVPEPQSLEQTPPDTTKKGRVSWSMKPLPELLGKKERKTDDRLLEVPDAIGYTPMVIGRDIQMRPPVPGVLFHVTTKKTIRGRIVIVETPPAPLPETMATFSPIFTLAHAPSGILGTTAISIKLEPGRCAPEHFSALELYAWDNELGWYPIPGQKASPRTQSFSALDFGLRTYTILGPQQHLKNAQTSYGIEARSAK